MTEAEDEELEDNEERDPLADEEIEVTEEKIHNENEGDYRYTEEVWLDMRFENISVNYMHNLQLPC